MMVVLWLVVLATGLLVAVRASRWAVGHLTGLVAGTRIPPFLIGVTLVSIGTDLPEIANSIVASVTGHGDINIGDSIGSATVQTTLVLGALPLIVGAFPIAVGQVARIGIATVGALALGAALMVDGDVSRLDAIVMIAVWVVGTVLVWRHRLTTEPGTDDRGGGGAHLLKAMAGLVLVALGATIAIQALTELAALWAMPEYVIAFLLASVGTSLPELVVEVTAVRRRQWDLAVGDAIGSSFVDATLSLGIGPLIAPIAVTAGVVVVGSLVAAVAVGLAVLTLVQVRSHNRMTGAVLIGLFLVAYLFVTAWI